MTTKQPGEVAVDKIFISGHVYNVFAKRDSISKRFHVTATECIDRWPMTRADTGDKTLDSRLDSEVNDVLLRRECVCEFCDETTTTKSRDTDELICESCARKFAYDTIAIDESNSRPYHSLLVRDNELEDWAIAFGAYDRSVVVDEREDCDDAFAMIITTSSDQKSIDAAVAEHNAKAIAVEVDSVEQHKRQSGDVQLLTGECLHVEKQTSEGVETDAGLIHWELVAGFWSMFAPTSKLMFIPVDQDHVEDWLVDQFGGPYDHSRAADGPEMIGARDVDISTATIFELMHDDKFYRIIEHVEEQVVEVYVAEVEYSDDGDAENGPQTPSQEMGDFTLIESGFGVHVDRQNVKQSCLQIIEHAVADHAACEGGAA